MGRKYMRNDENNMVHLLSGKEDGKGNTRRNRNAGTREERVSNRERRWSGHDRVVSEGTANEAWAKNKEGR